MIKALKQSLSLIIFSSNLAMNIKTALYVISLSAFATLQCADKEQLRVELAAKEEQLKKLSEEIQKQEALYEHAKKRFIELRDLVLERKKQENAKQTKHQKSDEELFAEILHELKSFGEAYCNSHPTEKFISKKEFFGELPEHILLKFYLIKMATEYMPLKTLISEWEKCDREKTAITDLIRSNP